MNSKTPTTANTMFREAGLAVAVLAIYVLTLLLPLHQAAGLQRDLNAMGFSTLDNWSICQSLAQDENGDLRDAALTCPAMGIAKHQFAAVLPPVLILAAPVLATLDSPRLPLVHLLPSPPDHVGQQRAPPVSV